MITHPNQKKEKMWLINNIYPTIMSQLFHQIFLAKRKLTSTKAYIGHIANNYR